MTAKFKYQVVLYDTRDYILEYRGFVSTEAGNLELARYLSAAFEKNTSHKIEITRWDFKTGEKV